MEIKELTNEELILLFKDNNLSMLAIERKYNLGKNSVSRLFNKRGINYKQIKELEIKHIRLEYESNPKLCKNCGKPILFEERNKKDFCCLSCAATYNNLQRNGGVRKSEDPSKIHYCLNCGITLRYSTSSKMKYCSAKCLLEHNYKEYIEQWKNEEVDGRSGKYEVSHYIRRYLFNKYNNSCQNCGWNKINPVTGLVPLQIHHIDGDCLNNREDNLLLLCPNCHSLTETYGNLNKQSSRVYRKQKENIEQA